MDLGVPEDSLTKHGVGGAWIMPRPSDVAHIIPDLGDSTDGVRRRRAGGTKARTGCVTCKARHVKCDEGKPTCGRCELAKVECQGYVGPVDKRRAREAIRRAMPRLIAPRQAAELGAAARAEPVVLRQIQIPRSPSSLPSISHNDGIYFDYFRHQVSTNMAGYYTSPIWSHLIIGEGLQDDSIHHSILAVGALIRAVPEATPRGLKSMSNQNSVTGHRETALRHHVKAVKSLRQRIEKMAAASPRTVVITTLLLVVFELVQGETTTAETLLNSGLSILRDFITLFENKANAASRKSADVAFNDMEHVLPCISAMSQLSHLFRPLRSNLHMFKMDPDLHFPSSKCESISEFFISWGRFFTFSTVFVGHCTSALAESPSSPERIELLAQRQQSFLAELEEWEGIILYYKDGSHIEDASKKSLRIAQIHWLLLHILLTCCLDSTQVAYDAFEPQFRDLTVQCISLFRDCLSHPRPTSVLLGQGILLPLCTVVRTCRNHDIRMMAVEALNELPFSMVAWDVMSNLDGLLGAVLLEEMGRDENGLVPPESRWFWLGDEVDEGGKLKRVYQRILPDGHGRPVLRELNLVQNIRLKICEVVNCSKGHRLGCVMRS